MRLTWPEFVEEVEKAFERQGIFRDIQIAWVSWENYIGGIYIQQFSDIEGQHPVPWEFDPADPEKNRKILHGPVKSIGIGSD